MKFGKFKEFTNGWVVGDFTPCLFNSKDNDIGVLYPKKGDESDGHFHKKHIEYNIILSGSALVNDRVLYKKDIFTYEPFDKSIVKFLADTILLVIKSPSTKNDKYYE